MNKHIVPAVGFDKTEALAVIEPFYFAFRHSLDPLLNLYFPLLAGAALQAPAAWSWLKAERFLSAGTAGLKL